MSTESTPPLWEGSRAALHGQILQLSNKLAGVYRRAIYLLDEVPPTGEELVRVALIGHCMRELMNRLPDVLNDVPNMLRPIKPSSDTLRDTLVELLDASGEMGSSEAYVSVKIEVVEALQTFAAAVRAESARAAEKDSVSVTQTRGANHAAVQHWRKARRFFVSLTHLDSRIGADADAERLPTNDEILRNVVVVEAALRSRLFGFFDARREIDQRLALINELIPDEAGS